MENDVFDRTKDTNELVYPGTKLAVKEEFIGGTGTYNTKDYVFSAVTGHVVINLDKHEISILPKAKTTPIPKNGDTFIGGVVNTSRQMVTISVNYINNVEIQPSYTLVVHVSQISRDYLESTEDVIRQGDIVRGKIIDSKTIPLQGKMSGSQLGVISSRCSKCGQRLKKVGRNKLKCKECSNFEYRKTTIDYGSGHLAFKL